MATAFTPNYQLKKPDTSDYFNVQDANGNMDILDSEIKKVSDSVNTVTTNGASKLATARNINGVAFDGTKDITINATASGGNAATADKLATARTISGVAFDGSSNITLSAATVGAAAASHVHSAGDVTSGTLPVARGGTGQTTVAAVRNAFGLGNTTGAVPVANGGTGQTTVAAMRNAFGLGNTAGAVPVANGGTGQTTVAAMRNAFGLGNTAGAVPVANGGTGAADAAAARNNLGAAPLASPVFTGTAKTTANTNYGTLQLRNIYCGTGTISSLENGAIYLQYE